MLTPDARALIAKGPGCQGARASIWASSIKEEVLRLAVSRARWVSSNDIFRRLGAVERPGEALGPLRRAVNLGRRRRGPLLARAFQQQRFVAARLACARPVCRRGRLRDDGRDQEIEAARDSTTAWRDRRRRPGLSGQQDPAVGSAGARSTPCWSLPLGRCRYLRGGCSFRALPWRNVCSTEPPREARGSLTPPWATTT